MTTVVYVLLVDWIGFRDDARGIIMVTGSKTGKKHSPPIGFYREDGEACLWVMTSRDRTWWRNVRNGANVTLLLKGKNVNAFAQVESEAKTVEIRLLDYIRQIPMAAKS
jgi:general stress protein 26